MSRARSQLSEKELKRQLRRQRPEGILEAMTKGGRIKLESVKKFMELYPKKAKFNFHIELVVESTCLFKTIDNEADLQDVLTALERAPDREKPNEDLHRGGKEGGKIDPRE